MVHPEFRCSDLIGPDVLLPLEILLRAHVVFSGQPSLLFGQLTPRTLLTLLRLRGRSIGRTVLRDLLIPLDLLSRPLLLRLLLTRTLLSSRLLSLSLRRRSSLLVRLLSHLLSLWRLTLGLRLRLTLSLSLGSRLLSLHLRLLLLLLTLLGLTPLPLCLILETLYCVVKHLHDTFVLPDLVREVLTLCQSLHRRLHLLIVGVLLPHVLLDRLLRVPTDHLVHLLAKRTDLLLHRLRQNSAGIIDEVVEIKLVGPILLRLPLLSLWLLLPLLLVSEPLIHLCPSLFGQLIEPLDLFRALSSQVRMLEGRLLPPVSWSLTSLLLGRTLAPTLRL